MIIRGRGRSLCVTQLGQLFKSRFFLVHFNPHRSAVAEAPIAHALVPRGADAVEHLVLDHEATVGSEVVKVLHVPLLPVCSSLLLRRLLVLKLLLAAAAVGLLVAVKVMLALVGMLIALLCYKKGYLQFGKTKDADDELL